MIDTRASGRTGTESIAKRVDEESSTEIDAAVREQLRARGLYP
jgi:hypothetical protein